MKKRKKKNINYPFNPATNKKILTHQVILTDLKGQKATFKDWLLLLVALIIVIVLGSLVFPMFYLFILNIIKTSVKYIRTNRNRKHLRYKLFVLPCIEKRVAEHESNPDELLLWFADIANELNVAIPVEKEEFHKTEVGDFFYIVFAPKEDTPCLCYRCSEWELPIATQQV